MKIARLFNRRIVFNGLVRLLWFWYCPVFWILWIMTHIRSDKIAVLNQKDDQSQRIVIKSMRNTEQ